MRRVIALYASYMLIAVIGMGATALLLGILSAPQPERYLLAAGAGILLAIVAPGAAFFFWVFPQLVVRLNRYEGRENRSPLELISEALGTVRPVRRVD